MNSRQYLTFGLGPATLALDIVLIKEINQRLALTALHGVSEHVAGTANLRGQIITVLDPSPRLGLPAVDLRDRNTVLVLKTETELRRYHRDEFLEDRVVDDRVGLLVDSIGDVVEIKSTQIKQPPENLPKEFKRHLRGVARVNGGLLLALHLESLLTVGETDES